MKRGGWLDRTIDLAESEGPGSTAALCKLIAALVAALALTFGVLPALILWIVRWVG